MPPRHLRVLWACLALGSWLVVGGCVGEKAEPTALEPHQGPILLITIDTLRADSVGFLNPQVETLTPHLNQLANDSQIAARSLSSSSWTVPSMASIFTGLQPWSHGNWHSDRVQLSEDLTTLPEALKQAGFETMAFRSNQWLSHKRGWGQGFDGFYKLGQRKRARAVLESLPSTSTFLWFHVLPPHAPYVRDDSLEDQVSATLDEPPLDLPEVVRPAALETWFDPHVKLEPDDRRNLEALYRYNVARSDRIVGDLLATLKASGQYDRSLIVVTSDHGEEFGENQQITHGGSLHPVLIEVPLIVKLPKNSPWTFPTSLVREDGGASSALANQRIFATLLEIAGGSIDFHPARAPSLFQNDEWPPLAELYLGNSENQFALTQLDGAGTLRTTVKRVPFAPPEPEFFAARLSELSPTGLANQLSEAPENIFNRQRRAFALAKPLSGLGTPTLDSFPGGQQATDSDQVEQLDQLWLERNGPDQEPGDLGAQPAEELSPEELEELRALGYVPSQN